MNRIIGLTLILLVYGWQAYSQTKEIETEEQTWFGYFNQTRLTKRSGIWVDLHLRLTGNFIEHVGLSIARAGYTYYVNDHVKLTAGYAFVTRYSQTGGPNVPEHRPWQQIQWIEKKNRFTMMQWFRVEERFRRIVEAGELTNDYSFNWRFRYNISFTIPLKGKTLEPKTPFIFLNDEVHINAGKNILVNYFDQNRLFLGLGYQFTSRLNTHVGYMYVFQQQSEVNKFVHIDAIRFFVFHNLDFRHQE